MPGLSIIRYFDIPEHRLRLGVMEWYGPSVCSRHGGNWARLPTCSFDNDRWQFQYAIKYMPYLDTAPHLNGIVCSQILTYDHHGWGKTRVTCFFLQNMKLPYSITIVFDIDTFVKGSPHSMFMVILVSRHHVLVYFLSIPQIGKMNSRSMETVRFPLHQENIRASQLFLYISFIHFTLLYLQILLPLLIWQKNKNCFLQLPINY